MLSLPFVHTPLGAGWARAERGYDPVISLHFINSFQLSAGWARIRCSDFTAPYPFISAGRGLGTGWAQVGRGQGVVISLHLIHSFAQGAGWARVRRVRG